MKGRHRDLVTNAERYKSALHEFFLDTPSWRKFAPSIPLTWQKVKFGESSKPHIPEERGIYAFTMEVAAANLPAHGYIMYMGITGDISAANLRKRFAQYLLDLKNEDGRPKVFYMLQQWSNELFFNFVPIPDVAVSLSDIERSFLNAVAPPINERDFDGDLSAARKATF